MQRLLIMASLLALSSNALATLPTNIMSRPAGFKDPIVEGVRVQPAQGCTWTEFKNDLIAHKTDTEWPYSIERYHNTPTAGSKYAVVFSAKDQTISVTWTPDGDLGPMPPTLTTYQTTSDANRLNRLKTLQKADRNASPYNNFTKSKVYRRELNTLYTSKFNDRTDCVDYQGLEYKWSMATADPTQFVKANTNWAEYKQAYGLSLSEKDPSRLGTMVIVDGTVNLNGIQDPSRFEVITTDDLDGKTFVKQAYSEAELLEFPADRILSTVNDNTVQHANVMGNLATALSEADVVVLPTAPGGNLNMYSPDTPKLNNATTDSLEKAVKYIDRHYLDLNASVVVITADVPPEGNLKELYNTLDNLRDKNISIIMSAGNDGVHETADEGSTYPNLAGTFHIVNGSPVTVAGVLGPDGDLVSNYGNDIQSVLRIKPEATTIENYAPGGLTSVVDVSLSELDLTAGATGGSSYAAVIIGSLAVDLKAKFPWLSSDEFKTGIVDGLYANRPEPPFAASQAELDLFNEKWSKVSGGIFDAKLLADYIKETYGKYRAIPEANMYIRDPAAPLRYQLLVAPNTWANSTNWTSAQLACDNTLQRIERSIYENITATVTQQPTFVVDGRCTLTATKKVTHEPYSLNYNLRIATPHAVIEFKANTITELLAEANEPSKSLYNGRKVWQQNTTNPYGWWVDLVDVYPDDGVSATQGPLNIGPDRWLCNHPDNNWGGTLKTSYTNPMIRYCEFPG